MSAKERRRVFLAIPLGTTQQQGITAFRALNTHLEQPGLRWITTQNLHMTVFYLGPVLLRHIESIDAAIRPLLASCPQFRLNFEAFCAQPQKHPRMLWARFARHKHFTALAQDIARACEPFLLNHGKHHKQPIPHVTIARLKKPPAGVLQDDATVPDLTVKTVELWLSETSTKGAIYSSLATFRLGGSQLPSR